MAASTRAHTVFVSVSGMDIIPIIALQWFLGKGKRELCVEWKD
jgi:hypothetical protein